MVPAVEKLEAAGIPVTNVNERLAGGRTVAYVGTDDYQLALATARHLIDAMGRKGNVVILEGPETLPTSIARVKAYKDVLKEFPEVKLLASKTANYARTPAVQVMKSWLRPSNSSASVASPSGASKTYSLSIFTHGNARCSAAN